MQQFISSIIQKYPVLSEEKVYALYMEIQDGSIEARNLLVLSNSRIIVNVCQKMHVSESYFEEVFQECFIVMLKKIRDFDPVKGSFYNFIYPWLVECIRKNNPSGMSIHTMSVLKKIRRVRTLFISEFHRYPSVSEIVEATGLSEKVVMTNLKYEYFYKNKVSLDISVSSSDNMDVCLMDLCADESNPSPIDSAVYSDLTEKLYSGFQYLSNRQKKVLDCLYNLSGQFPHSLSLREAEEIMGIKRTAIAGERDVSLKILKAAISGKMLGNAA